MYRATHYWGQSWSMSLADRQIYCSIESFQGSYLRSCCSPFHLLYQATFWSNSSGLGELELAMWELGFAPASPPSINYFCSLTHLSAITAKVARVGTFSTFSTMKWFPTNRLPHILKWAFTYHLLLPYLWKFLSGLPSLVSSNWSQIHLSIVRFHLASAHRASC